MIDTAGEEPAIDGKDVARDETRSVGCEENGGADEFMEFAKAAHGRAREKFLAAFGAVEKTGIQIGAKDSWSDGVDTNALASPFDGEGFGERSDSGFAGGVGRDFVESDEAGKGSNINDAAVASFDHVAANDAASAECAGQICLEDGVPLCVGKIESRSTLGAAGAVDENLNTAEFLGRSREQILDCGFIGDVAGNFERASAERTDFLCGGLHEIHAAAGGDNVGPGLREAFGNFKPNAAGAADDERGFGVQFELRMAQGVFAPLTRVKKRFDSTQRRSK